jgi:hypothetical protein
MVIFHSYVSLQEGIFREYRSFSVGSTVFIALINHVAKKLTNPFPKSNKWLV